MPKPKNIVLARSERLYLTAIKEEDAPIFAKWYNDPEVYGHLRDMGYQTTPEEQRAWIRQTASDPTLQVFSIYFIPDDQIIGDGGFKNINLEDRIAEIWLIIGEARYRGMGLGKEARWLLCKYGFETLNYHNILGEHYANNPISLSNALKTGAKLVGTRREARLHEGRRLDVHYTDMLRHELIQPPKK